MNLSHEFKVGIKAKFVEDCNEGLIKFHSIEGLCYVRYIAIKVHLILGGIAKAVASPAGSTD
ncbi:hypothetical protein D3C78_1553710 [compost metagenome]